MKKLFLLSCLLLGSFLFPSSNVSAWMDVPTEEVTYDEVSFHANGNLFKVGEEITIQEAMEDSIYVVAAKVDLQAPPKGDVYIVATDFTVKNPLLEDLFIAASEVTIDSEVMGDIYVVAAKLTITKEAHIHGNVYSWVADTNIGGAVDGDVFARGQKFSLKGRIAGNADAKFQLYDISWDSVIEGNFHYSGKEYIEGLDKIVLGDWKQEDVSRLSLKQYEKFFMISFGVWDIVSEFLVALFVLFFFSSFAYKLAETIRKEPFQHFGIGILGMLGIGIGCFVLAFTLIGLSLAFLSGLFGLFLVLITESFLYVMLLSYWKASWRKKWGQRVLLLLLHVIIVKAFAFVPVFGPIIIIFAWLMVFGGLVKTVILSLKHERTLGH